MRRANSKFKLEAGDSKDKVLYRPEFGKKDANEKIWELMSSYIGSDQKSIQRSIINHVEYTLARTRFNFDNLGAYQATGYSVRDRLIEAWNDTQQYHTVSSFVSNPFFRPKTASACTTSLLSSSWAA
jgi:starch phosphorylase